MTDSKDSKDIWDPRMVEGKHIEGPFAFKLDEGANKIRIGMSLSPLPVIWMDVLIKLGYFPNRSLFIEHSILFYIHYLREKIDFDTVIKNEISALGFYEKLWEEKGEGDSD